MKLEVGMYVRTKDGKIAKFIKYDEEDKEELVTDYYEYSTIWIKDVIKASYNIIDLIEVGDYVNGQVVTEIIPENRKVEPSTMIYTGTNYYVGLYNEHIDTIVTKEQFESMSYKLGDDK